MSSQAIYRRWRPQRFGDVVGQDHVTRTLRNAVKSGRVAHGYLFCGPRGIAKTSTARILAKAINCLDPQDGEPCDVCDLCRAIATGTSYDVIEMDAASNGLVDNVRDLRQHVMTHPDQARRKVYILDEAHRMSAPAFDALLKTLEEPPEHVVFILVTSEADKIPATIASRCQRFDFRRLPQRGIVERLAEICAKESVAAEPAALDLIARAATGSMRDAQSILDQLFALGGDRIAVVDVETVLGTAGSSAARDLAAHVIRREQGQGLGLISRVVADGADPRQFCRDATEYLRGLLLIKLGGPDETVDVSAETRAEMASLANEATIELLLKAVKLFGQAEAGWKGTLHYQLPLELAFVDSTIDSPAPAAPPVPTTSTSGPPGRAPLSQPVSGAPTLPRPEQLSPSTAASPPPRAAAPAPRPLPSEQSDPPPATEALDLPEAQRRWAAVRDAIAPLNRALGGELAKTRVAALEGEVLIVHCQAPFARDQLTRNLKLVMDEWRRQFQQSPPVRCLVPENWESSGDGSPDPAQDPRIRKAVERGWRARIVESDRE